MKRFLVCAITFALVCFAVPINASALSTSAKAAVVINGHTGEVLYAHNADSRLPMASTTKIMTALLLAECNTPEKEIVTTKEMVMVEGSSMGLLVGDKVTYNDLLYGMLLASGNDAANTTAICVGGNIENFVRMMNERAGEIGLVNTSFETPSGLDGENHYTTAYELALIAREAMRNADFKKAASSKTARLCYGNPPYYRTLTNHNKLLGNYDGIIGVKTGFTKKSGRCLVSAAERDGEYVIAVTLNDPNDWADHKNMLDFGFEKIQTVECNPPKMGPVLVVGGTKNTVSVSSKSLKIGVAVDGNINVRVEIPQVLFAPVKKGESIGTVEYYIGDTKLYVADIKTGENIKEKKDGLIQKFIGCLCLIIASV